jgi:DNA repair exonuclease SbcCD nuclease subunit
MADEVEREASDLPTILACHYTVRGAQLGGYSGRALFMQEIQIPLSVVTQPAFDYVALGHIHQHQDLSRGAQPPVLYPGSIERVDFSEEKEERGFILADISPGQSTWLHVPTPSRPFVTIRANLGVQAFRRSGIQEANRDGQDEQHRESDPSSSDHPVHPVHPCELSLEPESPVPSEPDPTEELLAAIERRATELPGAIVRVIYSLPDGLPPIREADVRAALKEAQFVAGIYRERAHREARERNTRLTTQLSPLEALQEYLATRPDLKDREAELLNYARPLIESLKREAAS